MIATYILIHVRTLCSLNLAFLIICFVIFQLSSLHVYYFSILLNVMSFMKFVSFINILNSCPTQGRVEGWDAMKPLYYRSVSSKGAGRPCLTHHHKGGWNETKWMSVEKWWNEICGRGKWEKPREKPTQTPFRPPSPTWRDRDANSGPQRWEASV